MRIENDIKLDFKDVLIRPKRSTLESRSQVSLERTYKALNAKTESGEAVNITCVPVIAANMDTTGTFEMAVAFQEQKMLVAIHKHYSLDEWKAFGAERADCLPYVFASMGIVERDFEFMDDLLKAVPQISMVMIDVANGYQESFVAAVRRARSMWPTKVLACGNIVTGEMCEELLLSGADIVKVGIGPGSVCTTRVTTGVGYPQLSAIIECADAGHGLGGLIVADGGVTTPGDVAKAFGAGSDFVMAGGIFSGYEESGGDLVEDEDGRKFKRFYGMSSAEAQKKHHGGLKEYRASEGKSVLVPYKGAVRPFLLQVLGGLRSACTYVGASSLKELSKRTTFVRCTQVVNQVFGESKGHK